jgi:hypothetical protein
MKPSLKKAVMKDPLSLIRVILESNFWPESLTPAKSYKRFEDDSAHGSLTVSFSWNGDGWIDVLSEPDPKDFNMTFRFRIPSFMGGGGESPRLRVALLILAEAIRLDNENNPQHRE